MPRCYAGKDTKCEKTLRSHYSSILPVLSPYFSVEMPATSMIESIKFDKRRVLHADVTVAFHPSGPSANGHDRQVGMDVLIAVAHTAAIQEQRMIERCCRRRRESLSVS